jgi:long-subunit fatty acid transport protein
MKKPNQPNSRHSDRTQSGVVGAVGAAAAAAVAAALTAAVPGDAVAGSALHAGTPDLAARVFALRQLLAEKHASVEGKARGVDPFLSPGTPVAQWNKWKNG